MMAASHAQGAILAMSSSYFRGRGSQPPRPNLIAGFIVSLLDGQVVSLALFAPVAAAAAAAAAGDPPSLGLTAAASAILSVRVVPPRCRRSCVRRDCLRRVSSACARIVAAARLPPRLVPPPLRRQCRRRCRRRRQDWCRRQDCCRRCRRRWCRRRRCRGRRRCRAWCRYCRRQPTVRPCRVPTRCHRQDDVPAAPPAAVSPEWLSWPGPLDFEWLPWPEKL